ncbi:Uncharacterised protein [Faecalibacterium prausnitzii]|nr:Uncharacterised protein [Faecalibacterium prausnitzii]
MRFVRNSEVLYTSENEKRTTALLKSLGFQLPIGLQRYSSIGSITYADGGVKFVGVPFTEIEASSGSLLVSDDAGQIKQKQESADTVLKTEEGGERPDFPARNSITQDTTESKRTDEPVKKSVRFQMAEQADREARKNVQRKASRTIADNCAAIKTLTEMMGLTRGVRVSDDSILGVAERLDDPELQRWA